MATAGLRTLLLGAGAVSKLFYVPLFRRGIPGLELRAVADLSGDALAQLGPLPDGVRCLQIGFEQALGDADLLGSVDAVLVALPHDLHAPAVVAALRAGKHVFCEKPLALAGSEVEEIGRQLRASPGVLAVCQPRRNYPAARAVASLVASGVLGKPLRAEWREGQPYAWPATTIAQLLEERGGSELFDIGAHVFDLLGWWFGDLDVVDCEDDSMGGTPAEYRVGLRSRAGVDAQVSLSRLRTLENTVEVAFEKGVVTWQLRDPDRITLVSEVFPGIGAARIAPALANQSGSMIDAVGADLLQFARAAQSGDAVNAGIEDARRYARIFDQCRTRRRQHVPAGPEASSQPTFAVTGAAGFIGCATVERLHASGARVRALVHTPRSAARLARVAVPIRCVDVSDAKTLENAFERGEIVIHCAVSHGRPQETIVEGTLNVLEAAHAAGAARVVVLSSMLAMGDPPPSGVVDEQRAANGSSMHYAQAKADMERLALDFGRRSGLEVVVLRPTCVFGPYGSDFGTAHLDAMLSRRFFFVESGSGRANLVYIDNLVDAILLAARKPGIAGSCFLVNEEEFNSTWGEYLGDLGAAALGERAGQLPSFSLAELAELRREWQRRNAFPAAFRAAIRAHPATRDWLARSRLFGLWKAARHRPAALPAEAAGTNGNAGTAVESHASDPKASLREELVGGRRLFIDESFGAFFASKAVYSSSRLRSELGWTPRVSRADALSALRTWARQAYEWRA